MHSLVRQPKDVLSGLLFIALGGFFLFEALNYNLGTVRRMGPGWFPTAVASLLIVVGVLVFLKGFVGRRADGPSFSWKPLAIVSAGLIAFLLLLRPAGIVPAVVSLVMIVAYAYPPVAVAKMLAVAVGLGLGCWLVFVEGLGLPFPKFGQTIDLIIDPIIEPLRVALRAFFRLFRGG